MNTRAGNSSILFTKRTLAYHEHILHTNSIACFLNISFKEVLELLVILIDCYPLLIAQLNQQQGVLIYLLLFDNSCFLF